MTGPVLFFSFCLGRLSLSPTPYSVSLIAAYFFCAFFFFGVCKQERKDGGHEAVSEGGKSTRLKVFQRSSSELAVICVTFVTQRDDWRGIKVQGLGGFLVLVEK